MMVYAFRALEKKDIKSLSTEQFDSIYDLFCEIFNICLAEQIKKRFKKRIHYDKRQNSYYKRKT